MSRSVLRDMPVARTNDSRFIPSEVRRAITSSASLVRGHLGAGRYGTRIVCRLVARLVPSCSVAHVP